MARPTQIVRDGYDKVSHAYRDDAGVEAEARYTPWLTTLSCDLDDGACILDLGCGNGVPAALLLSGRFQVTGVDISPVQIDRARRLASRARFRCADMSTVSFEPASFDAVISFYSIIHVPLPDQPALLDRIAAWLKPGGRFAATLGWTAWTGFEDDWLGVRGARMYWSQADAETYRGWLENAGFEVLSMQAVQEPGGEHSLFQARRSRG